MTPSSSQLDLDAGHWLTRLIGIDVRSMAAFRILLGLVFLADLALRWPDFDAWYADAGMFSLETSRAMFGYPLRWSIHWLSDEPIYQRAVFVLAAITAACLLIGWQTRLVTFATWIFVVSFWHRNPLICNYGDSWLRLLLFWSLFLPLGATWSIDAWRRQKKGLASSAMRTVSSVGTACILVQLTLFYLFAGIWKWNGDWLSGEAVRHALQLEYAVRPRAALLLKWPSLLKPLTHATLVLEVLGPLVIWLPWRTSWWRSAMIVAFVLLHVSIELCFVPIMLSYVSMIPWILLVPTTFWDSRWMRSWTERWVRGVAKAQPSQLHSREVLGANARSQPVSQPLSGTMRTVGKRIADATAISALALVIVWNLATFSPAYFGRLMPPALQDIGEITMLWQTWDMFYEPSRHNGWFVAAAKSRDGRTLDLLNHEQPFDREHPHSHWNELPNPRWRIAFRRLGEDKFAQFRQGVADYLLRNANRGREAPDQFVRLDLLYVERNASPASDLPAYRTRQFATSTIEEPPAPDSLQRAFDAFDREFYDP